MSSRPKAVQVCRHRVLRARVGAAIGRCAGPQAL
jgi:hypothetical protein